MADLLDDEFKKEADEAGSLKDTLQKRQEDKEQAALKAATEKTNEPDKKKEEAAEEEKEDDDFGIPADETEEATEDKADEEEKDPEERKPESAEDSDPGPNQQNARRRINKKVQSLNDRLDEEQKENEKLRRDKKVAQEETAAYRALEESEEGDSKKETLAEPKPEDFDLEDEDPEFIKKHTAWKDADIDKRVEAKLSQFLGKIQSNKEETDKQNRQEEHYRRVEKSGNTNYEKEEETVIKVLGAKNVAGIIKLFDDADIIIKNLAYDRETMDETLEAVKIGDKVGLIRLLERASNKNKGKTRKVTTPDSDDFDETGVSKEGSDKYFEEGATFT